MAVKSKSHPCTRPLASQVREDKRQQALFSFFRGFMDREFGGTGVGNFLSNEVCRVSVLRVVFALVHTLKIKMH